MPSEMQPSHLTKQQFGNRVYQLMLGKGWKQSDLARRADLTRDSVSKYVLGRSLPSPLNLKKLAAALDVEPEALLPNYVESAIEADNPLMEMKVSHNDPNIAWLRVNRLVTTSTAMEVLGILANDKAIKAADGK